MKRRVLAVALFCLVLFGAILAGYWDMLDAERLRLVRDQADRAVGEISSIVRTQREPEAGGNAAGPMPAPQASAQAGAEGAGAAPRVDGPPPLPASKTEAAAAVGASPARAGADGAPATADAEAGRESATAAAPSPEASILSTTDGRTDAPPVTATAAPNVSPMTQAPLDAAPVTAVPPAEGQTSPAETAAATRSPPPSGTQAAPSGGEPPDEAADTPGVDATRQAAASSQPQGDPPATPPPAASDAASKREPLPAPTFDILRVEPDGSTVLAGKAPVGATIRLQDGDTTIGSDTASPTGDFVVVLDERLPAGEHEIKIEATTPDGRSSTSAETAIFSIPEPGREEELLALVETPDEASRLITLPSAPPPAPGGPLASEPAAQVPAGTDAMLPEASAAAPAMIDAPQPLPSENLSGSEAPGNVRASQSAAIDPPPQDTPRRGQSGPAPSADASQGRALAVEAVEIEDDTIFVAGRAPVGPTIRVYVDNRFLAEDSGRTGDRFLVASKSAVTPGEHMVRADEIGPDGAVVARVEVPFFKPEGRSMAAISPAERPDASRGAEEMSAARDEAPGTAAPPPAAAGGGEAPTSAEPEMPGASEMATTQPFEPAEPALNSSLPEAPATVGGGVRPADAVDARPAPERVPSSPDDQMPTPREAASPAFGQRPAATQEQATLAERIAPPPLPSDPIEKSAVSNSALRSPQDDAGPAPVREAGPSRPPVEDASQPEPRDTTPELATATLPDAFPAAELPALEPPEAEASASAGVAPDDIVVSRQAPLQAVGSRVIIRRGDTLWRISRETYGRGARYTVIYLANGDQIRSPHRIYPGQVFRVPDGVDGDGASEAGSLGPGTSIE